MTNNAIARPVGQPAETSSQFFSTSYSLMPKIREFQKGPVDREIGEIESIARKVVGELCFLALIVIMIVEAVVRGVFVVIGEMLNSLGALLETRDVKPQPAPAPAPEPKNNNDSTDAAVTTDELPDAAVISAL